MKLSMYVHRVFVGAFILGLAITMTLPAGADDSDANQQLRKLEKAAVELEAVADSFRVKQAEMALHLSSAQRQEAKALAGITADTHLLGLMLGPADPKATKRNTGKVTGLTAGLQSALDAFKKKVAEARRYQDEICANAKLLKSDPPPPSGRISGWADRADRLLETSTTGLRTKRAALTSAWNALSQAAGDLAIQLGRLEALVSQSRDFQAVYGRLAGYRAALEAAEKDLAKAGELRKELATVLATFPARERALRGQLQRLQMLTPVSSGLRPRIDAALGKLKGMALPGILPEVGQISEPAKQMLKDMASINPAEVAANLQQAKSVAAAARPVLNKANSALHQASSAQAGFDGLERGRRCGDQLRRAKAGSGASPDPLQKLVGDLRTRLEKAERLEHIFTVRNQKSRRLYDAARSMADLAEAAIHTWQAVPGLLAERLGDVKTGPLISNLETLLPALDQGRAAMQTTAAVLAKAAQDAGRQKGEICRHAKQAGSTPPPSVAQVNTWHQESTNKIKAIRGTVTAAHKAARAQAAELGRLVKRVTTAKDQLVNAKDSLVIWLRARANIHVQMVKSRDLLKEALTEGAKSDREREELVRFKKALLEDVIELQKIAAYQIARLADGGTKAELEYIRARAAALAARYQKAHIVEKFRKPAYSPEAFARDIKILSELVSRTEQEIGQAVRVIKQAETSLGQVQAVRLSAARHSGAASGLLVEAERCAAVLAKGPSPSGSGGGEGENEAKARQALAGCDYSGATALINALPQGAARDGLLKQLADQQAQDKEARALLAQAQALYDACQHDQALSTLATAQQKAKCTGDLRAIADLRTKAEAAKPADAQVAILRSRAGGEFEACQLQASMTLLLRAQAMAKCKRHREGIRREISLVTEAQAAEPQYQLQLGQAIAKYQDCRLTAALQLLEQAKPFAKCRKYKSRISSMIRKATKKKAYESTTLRMFESAKKLYLDGEYVKARDMFLKAKEYTTCTRFVTGLEPWIAKANAQIGSGQVPPVQDQPPPPDPPPSGPCADLARQMATQAGKIHQTWRHWGALKQAGQPPSITGPAACRVAAAIDGFRSLKKQAQDARCQDTVSYSRPNGAPNWPVAACGTWRGGQGRQTDPPSNRCDEWKRKLAEAHRVYKASSRAYVSAHHERSRTGTPAAFAKLDRAICAKYAANVKLYQLVLAARRAGCQVPDPTSANFRKLVEQKRLCTGQSSVTTQQPTSCDDYVRQLRAQEEKVRQLVLRHNAAVSAGPYTRARGELGCMVKRASDLFNQINDNAVRARCRNLVYMIKNPAGGGGLYPYFRDCTRWSQGSAR